MFRVNLTTAIRNLWKNKTYSFLNIFGLAIGIACAGLIFLWAENEISWDSNNINKRNLYAIRENATYAGNTFTNWSTPRPIASRVKAEIPGVVNTCRISDESENLLCTVGDRSIYTAGKFCDSSLFSMFTLPFVQGNASTAFNQLYSIVLTQTTAKKIFGAEQNVIGKTVRIDNKQDYIVTGIL
ncbi:MAG TPA: ABC transporter permease, partial [Chitinophagaceae bacterium]